MFQSSDDLLDSMPCLQLNNALSFGQHRVWKKLAVEWARVKPGCQALDVCCGSGDLALLLAQRAGADGQVRHNNATSWHAWAHRW